MKLVTYLKEEREQLGVLINGMLYDMEVLHPELPNPYQQPGYSDQRGAVAGPDPLPYFLPGWLCISSARGSSPA